jgi:hypothetical protein
MAKRLGPPTLIILGTAVLASSHGVSSSLLISAALLYEPPWVGVIAALIVVMDARKQIPIGTFIMAIMLGFVIALGIGPTPNRLLQNKDALPVAGIFIGLAVLFTPNEVYANASGHRWAFILPRRVRLSSLHRSHNELSVSAILATTTVDLSAPIRRSHIVHLQISCWGGAVVLLLSPETSIKIGEYAGRFIQLDAVGTQPWNPHSPQKVLLSVSGAFGRVALERRQAHSSRDM